MFLFHVPLRWLEASLSEIQIFLLLFIEAVYLRIPIPALPSNLELCLLASVSNFFVADHFGACMSDPSRLT